MRTAAERRQPVTYWEEYVETDEWYINELTIDVPPDEMHAACFGNVEEEEFDDDDAVAESSDEESDSAEDDDGLVENAFDDSE